MADSQQQPLRVVLVLIDGVGDVTIPAFGDRTPLQVAHTPNLDAVAGARARVVVPPPPPRRRWFCALLDSKAPPSPHTPPRTQQPPASRA